MKKIYIQILLILFTISFLGVTFFYYWQGPKVANELNIEKNPEIVAEEKVTESLFVFEEPILESGLEKQKVDDRNHSIEQEKFEKKKEIEKEKEKEIVKEWDEQEEISREKMIQKEISREKMIQKEISSIKKNKTTLTENSQEIIPSTFPIDLYSDGSIHKFVGSDISFGDTTYIPGDLEPFSSLYIVDSKGNGELRKEAAIQLKKLGEAFYEEFGEKIVVVSSYRSYAYQKGIKDRGCPDNLCAKAGYSEHQSGLAVDFWEATTNTQFLGKTHLKKYYNWLIQNAPTYGYHNSYQKGKTIDGYDIEPWHWRYVGEKLARYLNDNNLTLTQYYNLQSLNETE